MRDLQAYKFNKKKEKIPSFGGDFIKIGLNDLIPYTFLR